MNVRGRSIDAVQTRLDAFCRSAGFPGSFLYLLLANGRCIAVSGLVRRPRDWRALLSGLRQGFAGFLKLGIPRARVHIKNNIRIFYRRSDRDRASGPVEVTAKVGLPPWFGKGSLAREVRARRYVERRAASVVATPRLYRYERGTAEWLEEEYVAGRKCTEREKVDLFLTDCASRFYRSSARLRPVERSITRLGISVPDLDEVCAEVGLPIGSLSRGHYWPVGMIHGDMSPGNMMVGPTGRLILIDWELFGIGPVAWDLRSLVRFNLPLTVAVLREVSPEGSLDAEVQLQLALAMQLVLYRKDRESFLEYRRGHQRLSPSEAVERQATVEQQLLDDIKSLSLELNELFQPRGHSLGVADQETVHERLSATD